MRAREKEIGGGGLENEKKSHGPYTRNERCQMSAF